MAHKDKLAALPTDALRMPSLTALIWRISRCRTRIEPFPTLRTKCSFLQGGSESRVRSSLFRFVELFVCRLEIDPKLLAQSRHISKILFLESVTGMKFHHPFRRNA